MTRSGLLGLLVLLVAFAAVATMLWTLPRLHDESGNGQGAGYPVPRSSETERVGFLQRA